MEHLVEKGKLLIFLSILFLCGSCQIREKYHKKELYFDKDFILVQTNESSGLTQDKFHQPILVKSWLIRSIEDTTLFAEINSYRENTEFIITNELWYNHSIGDTLHFDYISKDRFFRIYKK